MKTVILLLALSALASTHAHSPPHYGSAGFVRPGVGGRPGVVGRPGVGNGGIGYGGGPIVFPDSHRPGGIRPGQVFRPGAGGVRPGAGGVRPVAGGSGVSSGGGFRPSTECSPLGCPVGPGEPTVTYLDQCYAYNIDQSDAVHETFGKSQYHFSWCVDGGKKYNWRQAQSYCRNLYGNDWRAVSIEDSRENRYITKIIESHRLPYIWTSGRRSPADFYQFVWKTLGRGEKYLTYTNWGQTGSQLRPQPDNNEAGGEECLAIINYFYPGDYTTWHDINCRHNKPVICEKSVSYSGYTG